MTHLQSGAGGDDEVQREDGGGQQQQHGLGQHVGDLRGEQRPCHTLRDAA